MMLKFNYHSSFQNKVRGENISHSLKKTKQKAPRTQEKYQLGIDSRQARDRCESLGRVLVMFFFAVSIGMGTHLWPV